jgi:energy-coupling factor transporter ATP-binding protein EcfA2
MLNIILYQHYTNAATFNSEKPVFYFTNQQKEIEKLTHKISVNNTVGITGLSGSGKSEIARKFAQDKQGSYKLIAFLDASVDLIPQFVKLSGFINKNFCNKQEICVSENYTDVKIDLMRYLKSKTDWLLIFDGLSINKNNSIKEFIDWKHNGHIIICSQDTQYLLQRISPSKADEKNSRVIINKIMKDPSINLIDELVYNTKDYPLYMIGHAAIYLDNNNHMTVKEYINHTKKYDNKISAHLDLVLKELPEEARYVLHLIALLNNNKLPKKFLEIIVGDKVDLTTSIDNLVRLGLIETISDDINNQIFRMHDLIQEEKLKKSSNKINKKYIEDLLNKVSQLMPEIVNDKAIFIKSDYIENNLECLINNADKFDVNLLKIASLKKDLLWYYLIYTRQNDKAKTIIDWFLYNKQKIESLSNNIQEKETYSSFLIFTAIYKYSASNETPKKAMQFLDQAETVLKNTNCCNELMTYVYSIKALIQISSGDIVNSKINIKKAEARRPDKLKTLLGAGLIEYNKSKILIAEGKYQEALNNVLLDIKYSKKKKSSLHLAPEYITKAKILNLMDSYQEAYSVIHSNLYEHTMKSKRDRVSGVILSQILRELSIAELGLGKNLESLDHAIDSVDILINSNRNTKKNNLENSRDVLLAQALVAKANAQVDNNQAAHAIENYKIAKNIYWNAYERSNIHNIHEVSYLLYQGVKASQKLDNQKDKTIEGNYFYQLLIEYFSADNLYRKKLKDTFNFQ